MSASNAATAAGVELNREQWEWTKARQPMLDKQTEDMIAMGREQYELDSEGQKFQQGLAKKYDNRYWEKVAPMQDKMVSDAQAFNTDGRREELASEAGADVNSAFSGARDQQSRGLSRMGVTPGSGRAMMADTALTLGQSTAMANAMNKTRTAARAEGYGRVVDANAMMSGMSGFSSSATQAAQGYGSNAVAASGVGMNGINAGGAARAAGASNAVSGYFNGAGNYRANAIESAKNPGFDAVMGLVAGGMKLAGSTYTGKGWG